ncbi:Fur-regulated basic protein FbpA, partial [Bacillus amyloliquefaciens]|nr:Fur-regulated basic protein FbpA [Bacillus amyloliquefaciens]
MNLYDSERMMRLAPLLREAINRKK